MKKQLMGFEESMPLINWAMEELSVQELADNMEKETTAINE